uniref:C-type lectin domain-containing protein n=1 Tax=Haemonchus contortus TaxID=6289 RepID=A0A7I5E6A6_HAECO|nr:C-type lectin domain containing protein [Haemonchus contortus]
MKSTVVLLLSALALATAIPAISVNDPRCDSDWTYFDLTSSCYYVGSQNNFDSAEADCVSLGGHLTSIHNGFENNLVASLTEVGTKEGPSDMTWIGLRFVQNKWAWTDGGDTSYLNWMKGRPEKDAGKYPCTQILQDDYKGSKTQWNDVDCGIKMRKYVCKKPSKS